MEVHFQFPKGTSLGKVYGKCLKGRQEQWATASVIPSRKTFLKTTHSKLLSLFSGQGIQPKRDLSRFVKWPKYVRLQRQRAILFKRLKVPPSINQFNQTLDRQTGINRSFIHPLPYLVNDSQCPRTKFYTTLAFSVHKMFCPNILLCLFKIIP